MHGVRYKISLDSIRHLSDMFLDLPRLCKITLFEGILAFILYPGFVSVCTVFKAGLILGR